MIRIVSDSSTLYTKAEADAIGIDIAMLTVTVNWKTYREQEEIKTEEFIDIIHQGHVPSSSQPAVGEVLDIYNKYPQDEMLNITISHAVAEDLLKTASEIISKAFPGIKILTFTLTPSFTVQGGPGCVAIQAIKA